jgi:hypothetical protein
MSKNGRKKALTGDRKAKPGDTAVLSRRAALARLGIGTALAYSAPTIVHLDRSANATLSATPCSSGRGRPRWCRGRNRHNHHGHDNRHGNDHDRDGNRRGRSRSRGHKG